MTQDGQLLRDDGLVERELLLEFLHRPVAAHQHLQNANARGVRQRPKKLRLESLQLAADWLSPWCVTLGRHR